MHIDPNNRAERSWTPIVLQAGVVITGVALIALGYLHMRGKLPLEKLPGGAFLKNTNSWALMGPGSGLIGTVALYQIFSGIKDKHSARLPKSSPSDVREPANKCIVQDGQLWNMPDLPLLEILEYATPESRARLAATCQKFRRLITNQNRYFVTAIPACSLPQLDECDLAYRLFVRIKKHGLNSCFYSQEPVPQAVYQSIDWTAVWRGKRQLELSGRRSSRYFTQRRTLYKTIGKKGNTDRYHQLEDGRMALVQYRRKDVYSSEYNEMLPRPWPIVKIYHPSCEKLCCFNIPASYSKHDLSLFSLRNGRIASWYAQKIRIWDQRGKELLCLDVPHQIALIMELDDQRLVFVTNLGRGRLLDRINGEGGFIIEFDPEKCSKKLSGEANPNPVWTAVFQILF